MKRYLIILVLFVIAGINPANADVIATNTFYVDADTTMTVITSGTLNAVISGETGQLSTPLNINFNISTNQDYDNIRLKAHTATSTSTNCCCCCTTTTGEAPSHTFLLALGNETHLASSIGINDCLCSSPQCDLNPNVIAYPGVVSISNGGTIEPQSSGEDHYMNCKVKAGVSDLNLTLSTTPKPGTYDVNSAQDEPDNYVVEVYLDNLP